jgi:hypothetical protein
LFASLMLSMAAATKKKRKEEAYPWKAGASSGHITNLKQSILETFDIYGFTTEIEGQAINSLSYFCPTKCD